MSSNNMNPPGNNHNHQGPNNTELTTKKFNGDDSDQSWFPKPWKSENKMHLLLQTTEELKERIDELNKMLSHSNKEFENKINNLYEDSITKQSQMETKLVGITTELKTHHNQIISEKNRELAKCQQSIEQLKIDVGRNESEVSRIQSSNRSILQYGNDLDKCQRNIDKLKIESNKEFGNKIQHLHDDSIKKQNQMDAKLTEITTELKTHSTDLAKFQQAIEDLKIDVCSIQTSNQSIVQYRKDLANCQQNIDDLKMAVRRNESSIQSIQGNQADKLREENKHKRETNLQEITDTTTYNEQVKQSVTETRGTAFKDLPNKPSFTPSNQGNVLSSTTQLHVGFVGSSGAGKSSLINAIRSLKPFDSDAALVDCKPIEKINKYEYHHKDGSLMLCDIPNMDDDDAASSKVERYFEEYKLEQLNLLIIVFAERFMEIDALIAKVAVDRKISFILVRTKSDLAIESKMEQKGLSVTEANTELRKQTQETVMSRLDLVGICDEKKKKIYCVSTRGFVGTQEQKEKFKMDEDKVASVIGALKKNHENNF